ncbi:MAG: ribosome maturation factor RimM [Treponema sp.]|nr:ribosome maturation factor RimM [Treponema sp.]MCL2250454.1 ribosome maturation factor RimM [Treponema sp.]
MIEKFIVGFLGAPFGVKGFIKVRSASGEIDHLLKLQSVIVSKDGKERTLKIAESKASGQSVLMHFAGIDSPEDAQILNGSLLLANREEAAPLSENEFYIEDLKGLSVVSESGEKIGSLTDIIEGGGGELAEIKMPSGEKKLVPFRKEFIKEILIAEKKIVLQNLWILE